MDLQEGDWEEFKTYDLVDVNCGLWYGVLISPSGRNRWIKEQCQSLIWSTTTSGYIKPMKTLPNNVNSKAEETYTKKEIII